MYRHTDIYLYRYIYIYIYIDVFGIQPVCSKVVAVCFISEPFFYREHIFWKSICVSLFVFLLKMKFFGRCQTHVFVFFAKEFAKGSGFQKSFSRLFERWSSFHIERTIRRSIRVIFVYEHLVNKNEGSLKDAKHIYEIFLIRKRWMDWQQHGKTSCSRLWYCFFVLLKMMISLRRQQCRLHLCIYV